MSGHTPWSEIKRKRAHEFSGVLYASDEDINDLLRQIAGIVCETGGTVISKPLLHDDIEIEGLSHDDD